ncbi:hypothetical protein CCMA1212_005492 [Trichoderma ghanense]|uniref:Uncharacterized protein n=1 Tax=Trichoderma ghanense TaxID=65468 RepID=A0ABY2H4R3_9HYPO
MAAPCGLRISAASWEKPHLDMACIRYSLSVLQGFTVRLGSWWDMLHDLLLGLSSLFPALSQKEKPRGW